MTFLAAVILTVPPLGWLLIAIVALAVFAAAHVGRRRGRGDDITPEQYGADRP